MHIEFFLGPLKCIIMHLRIDLFKKLKNKMKNKYSIYNDVLLISYNGDIWNRM